MPARRSAPQGRDQEGSALATEAEPGAPAAGDVVLLGDSIFDNKAYVNGGPDVIAQLRGQLPPGWRATLLALDGDVISGVARQLRAVPDDATFLVVSVGGNDALGYSSLLQEPAASVTAALDMLAGARDRFASDYEAMIAALGATGLPSAVCTIYDTPASGPGYRVIRTALAIFNDCITRAAFARGISLVDLRLICDQDADYANPIEPSVRGGAKIARAVAALALHGPGAAGSAVIARAD